MYPEKTRRSLRRFNRRIASYRRGALRRLRSAADSVNPWMERETDRVPTRQERRIDEAFRQDIRDVELV